MRVQKKKKNATNSSAVRISPHSQNRNPPPTQNRNQVLHSFGFASNFSAHLTSLWTQPVTIVYSAHSEPRPISPPTLRRDHSTHLEPQSGFPPTQNRKQFLRPLNIALDSVSQYQFLRPLRTAINFPPTQSRAQFLCPLNIAVDSAGHNGFLRPLRVAVIFFTRLEPIIYSAHSKPQSTSPSAPSRGQFPRALGTAMDSGSHNQFLYAELQSISPPT